MLSDYHCFRGIPFSLIWYCLFLFLSYLSGPSQTQKNQGEGDLHTRVAGPARLATEGRSKRSHWCTLLDCLPSTIEPDATSNNSNFIVLQCVWNWSESLLCRFFISQDVVHLRTTVGLLLVLSTVCSHTLLAISGPGCPYIHPKPSFLVFFLRSCLFHKFGNITLV